MRLKLSVEDYRTVGRVMAIMGALTAGIGIWLVFVGSSNMVVALFLFSWGITFLSVALYARKAIQYLRALQEA